MKSLKKVSMIKSLLFSVGFLGGAALTATGESRIDLEIGRHDATHAPTSAQVSSRNCLGSNCSANAFVALSSADVPPRLLGWGPIRSAAGTLTVSDISRVNNAPSGLSALQNGADRTAKNLSNFVLTLEDGESRSELHPTTASTTSRISSPYLQGSSDGIGSMVRRLFCSPPAREDCISENLFNSNPTIRSTSTGKVTLAPEPTAAFLLGTGLLAIGLIRRRQKTGRT